MLKLEKIEKVKKLYQKGIIEVDLGIIAWDLKAGTVLTTKDGRKPEIIGETVQNFTISLNGKQVDYPKSAIIKALITGNMTI